VLLLCNKPFGVLCQFTDRAGRPTLASLVPVPGVYPAGRLDADSEGLVLLTDDGALQARLADPRHGIEKVYWVQVEGVPGEAALDLLRRGVDLPDGRTRPAGARAIPPPPGLWPREPPIRRRAAIPTTWLEVRLREGRHRQVRRMTAAAGHPTLRLVRAAVGPFTLAGLAPGQWRQGDPRRLGPARPPGPVRPRRPRDLPGGGAPPAPGARPGGPRGRVGPAPRRAGGVSRRARRGRDGA
jgi:23S rRNA pseudouridine2457 synthase